MGRGSPGGSRGYTEPAASDRGRNAKHPAKVLTLNRWTRHRTIPAPTPAIRPRSDAAGIYKQKRRGGSDDPPDRSITPGP